ncbi:MAG: glycosyltransferase [Verrucomicrobiae bacterium]|nr:glycosyltransferase [Verrucomicrobiae bacterium]
MRILIATVTAGAGHLQAASALEESWRSLRPADTVQRVDVLDFTPRLYRKAVADGYLKLVGHAPELYALVFKKTDNPILVRKLNRLRRLSARLLAQKFVKHLKRFRPDVVLCPHFLPLEIIGSLTMGSTGVPACVRPESTGRDACATRVKTIVTPFTVCIVTDFEAHALWMEPCVDLYCVAAEMTKARLVARGVPGANIAVTGIPIAAKFSAKANPAAVRYQYGLRDDLPTLLVLGGGFGVGPVKRILAELDKLSKPVQALVVCGRNEELRREIASQDHRHPTHVLGFVSNMHELMAVSDMIVTKPGGLTSSEALAMGKPLVIIDPIPGQEAANSDFLLEHGVAIKLNRLEDLPFRIEKLICSKTLAAMARKAQALGRANAATAVCETVADQFMGKL